MTMFQWFFLGISTVVITTSPFTIVRAIRRGEKRHIIEISVLVSVMVWHDIRILRPALILSGPLFVRRYLLVAALGMLAVAYFKDIRHWYYRCKEAIVERR